VDEDNGKLLLIIDEAVSYCLEKYSYTLEHYYLKTFKEGGLTFGQLEELFDRAKKRDLEAFKQLAALQGIDLDNPGNKGGKSSGFNEKTQSYDDFYGGQKPLLPNAEDVKHMTDKEKDDLTKKSMANFSKVMGMK